MENQYQDSNIDKDDIVIVTDEDGNEHECIVLDIVEYKNKNYAALVAADYLDEMNDEPNNATDLFIMEIENTEDEKEEFFKLIDNDEDYEEICQLMIDRLSEDFDIEE